MISRFTPSQTLPLEGEGRVGIEGKGDLNHAGMEM